MWDCCRQATAPAPVHQRLFPMYVVKVTDFLSMQAVPEPHDILKARGLLHEWVPGMFSIFVSHQWLGSSHPDPEGAQAAILRQALQRMIQGKLHVEEDLVSYPQTRRLSSKERQQIASGYLFFDWFAIPQITARLPGVNEDLTRTQAAKAVQSIPGYVEVADLFLALVPEIVHTETGVRCNYASWLSRGWCRAEGWCHLLSNKLDTSVIVVYSGQESEFMFSLNWQRHKILEGNFTVEDDRAVVGKLGEVALDSKIEHLRRTGDVTLYRYYIAFRPILLGQEKPDMDLDEFIKYFHFESIGAAINDGPMNGLVCAVFAGNVPMVRLLAEHQANVNHRLCGLGSLGYFDSQTVLMAAAKSEQMPEMLSTLIELNADVTATTRVGINCAYLARSPGHVRVLCEAKADLHSTMVPTGLTPIAGPVVWASPDTVAAMLAAKCDPNPAVGGVGYGPLQALALLARSRQDNVTVARMLLDSRADLDSRAAPKSVWILLCGAARAHAALWGMENSSSLKKCLVSMPGLSPLGAAAFAGDEALCRLFLDRGAALEPNYHGSFPEDLAKLNGHNHLLPLLSRFSV
ncbi:unnamed protein product [Effrenium voratum]|uniref:Uncharacterized protein n=1 Tax=Effrenium voratum TaxID=2562239 RepID=A0AA36HPR6_9DINO|nr:unnamed protein product [Effrenium voratum]CAJ1372279.1 unnamed protein product [Effrenium voratum]CAJ1434896.1 unnamed protein product [Effrenium voratum]